MNTKRVSRRTFLQAAIGVTGVGLLAACAAPAPASTETTSAAAGAAPGIEGKEGVMWGLQYDPHVETYNRLADLFHETTGATLAVQPQAWPIEVKVIASMAAGTAPDVACIMGKVLMPLWIRNAVTDLTPLYEDKGLDPSETFYPDSVQCYTYEGKIWGVPTETGTVGWVVNVPVDDVEAAGVADMYPPTNGTLAFTSYEEMWNLAKELQVEDDAGNVIRWGLSSKGWDLCTIVGIMDELGTRFWDDGAETFNFTSDAGIQAFRLHAEMPVSLGIETELDQNHVDAALAGKVALAKGNGTPWVQGADLGYNFQLALTPPAIEGGFPKMGGEGGWGFAGFTQSKNQDVAMEFLSMMLTKEGQHSWAQIYGGKQSAMRVLADDLTIFTEELNKEQYLQFSEFPTAANTNYYGQGFGYIADLELHIGTAASDIRSGKINAEQAVEQVQERLEAAYQTYLDDLKKL